MTKNDKLKERLKKRPSDFEYSEARTLIIRLGYKEETRGRTSGSRVAFINIKTKHIIRLHKPHPGSIMRMYQIDQLIEELKFRSKQE